MANIKQAINKNALELVRLLDAVTAKMEQIAQLYQLLEQVEKDSVEYAELLSLIRLCENYYADEIFTMKSRVRYFARARCEGRISLGGNGRYRLNDHELTCGCGIEVFITDPDSDDWGWQFGRVEHNDNKGGYYFYNHSGNCNHRLVPGMQAAVRG